MDADDPLTIVEWITQGDVGDRDDLDHERAMGGMGGWFGYKQAKDRAEGEGLTHNGDRWKNYLAAMSPSIHVYLELWRSAVIARGLRHGGFWAQHGDSVAVYSDGRYTDPGMRCWGDMMAAVWSEHENKNYGYADFAWTDPDDGKVH